MANVEWDPDSYLETMLNEIPAYVELQRQVASASEGFEVHEVLELGTGTGETARRVLDVYPNARWTGIDANEAMLRRARETLPRADLRKSRLEDPLAEGPFDLVVSSLAVHHLDGAGKRDLFRRIYEVLRPGGPFVLGDVVVPENPDDAQIEIDWVVDLPDRLDEQLQWLREVGFDAETFWSQKDLAVLRASRRPLRGRSP
jgi:tRNA (cmo5U34)-methyltransferase